ncbi:MAG TPA: tetratricopeptide repeat protein [Longimicrobium sp.]|nr:tetratricopeptide repeat protein [Longimicrobium sp.]
MRRLFFLALVACVAAAAPETAAGQPEPPRPALRRGADPNDWEAYFDEGTRNFERFPNRAADAFYWASRLDPRRAEPLFARWAAYLAQDHSRWLAYVEEEERILERPDMVANEALRTRAFNRSPFVHRAFEAALWSRMNAQLRWNGATRAFMSYGAADFDQAAAGFGRVVRADPVRNARFRFWRALAFVGDSQLDSAAVEITQLLATLRAEDEAQVQELYESKAMLEHALGMLYSVGGHPVEARRAWERALEEDLSMYPARSELARLALREGRTAEAVELMAQAVEIAPDDAVMHFEYGNALLMAGRRAEAADAWLRATQLEPHWADPYLRLGMALDDAGQSEKAITALRAYLDRAPRRQTQEIRIATERLAALQAGG